MSDDLDLDWLWGGSLLPKETAKPVKLPTGTNDALDAWLGYELVISKPVDYQCPQCECGGQVTDIINNLHKEYCPIYGKIKLTKDQK